MGIFKASFIDIGNPTPEEIEAADAATSELFERFKPDPYLNMNFQGKRLDIFTNFLDSLHREHGEYTVHRSCIGSRDALRFFAFVYNRAANSWHIVLLNVKAIGGVSNQEFVEATESALIHKIMSLPLDQSNSMGDRLLELFDLIGKIR